MWVKCTLVKITSGGKTMFFHFEIDGKIYFYKFEGITADLKIVLYCSKILKSKCSNIANILPSEFLRKIIINTPKNCKPAYKSRFPKYFDKKDPRVIDINNYDINSFDIGRAHTCKGMHLNVYFGTKTVFKMDDKWNNLSP